MQQYTIHNCFRHSELIKSNDDSPIQILENKFVEEYDVPLSLGSKKKTKCRFSNNTGNMERMLILITLLLHATTDENIVQNINDKAQFGSDEREEVDEKLMIFYSASKLQQTD